MQETRYAVVDGEKIPVLLSDENEALLAAKAAGRAIVGLWREDTQGNEWCAADTLIADIAEGEYEEIVENHVDADLDTVEKVAGYTKHHYEVFEFGFWAVEEKKSGNLTGVVGFRIPQDDGIGDVDYYVLSLDDENILDDTLELGYHIFPEYRRKGYAKEACRAAIEYAEEEFGTVQFIVRIGKENIVSKKVAESLGFVRTE